MGGASQDLARGREGKELLLQKGEKPVFPLHVANPQNPLLQETEVWDALHGVSAEGREQRGLRHPQTFALTRSGALSGGRGICSKKLLFFFFNQ